MHDVNRQSYSEVLPAEDKKKQHTYFYHSFGNEDKKPNIILNSNNNNNGNRNEQQPMVERPRKQPTGKFSPSLLKLFRRAVT